MIAAALVLLALEPLGLTLAQARERAARQNGDLEAARLAVPAAEAGARAAGALPNPTLSVAAGNDDPRLTGSVDLKLPIFGQRGAAIDAASGEITVARAQSAAQAVRLAASVRRSFAGLVSAQAQAGLTAQALELATQVEKMTADRVAAGSGSQLELEQAALARKRAQQDLADRASALVEARQQLAALIGEPDAELAASEAAPEPQVPPLAALLDKVAANPELEALRAQRAASLARAELARVELRPTPDVSVGFEKQRDATPAWALRAGIAFDLPLFSQNQGRIAQAEAQARALEAQLRAALQRGRAGIRAARARWEAASARARFAQVETLPAAQHVAELARTGYTLGRAPLLAVLQAQSEVAATRARVVDAQGEAQRALADLEEAAGGEL